MQIQISNLKKCFGEKTAVDIADFTVNNGEIVGLVGNNGAGKTTLFRLMLDLLKADEGSVTLLPKPTDADTGMPEQINPALSEDWKTMTGAYIDPSFLIDFLSAEEYFEFIAKISGISKEGLAERLKYFEPFMNGECWDRKSTYATSLPATSRRLASSPHCSTSHSWLFSTSHSTFSTQAVRTS